jgi:HOOK protein.
MHLSNNPYTISTTCRLIQLLTVCRDPQHFDATTISRGNTNWALKANNLRKLLRYLEAYFHSTLYKTTNFSIFSDVITDIAKQEDVHAIALFVELITAACVTCDDRAKYIGWIMNMSEENQICMKGIVESSLGRLEDLERPLEEEEGDGSMNISKNYNDEYSMSDNDDEQNENEDDENIDEFGAEMSGLFRNAMKNLDSATEGMDLTIASPSEFSHHSHGISESGNKGGHMFDVIVRERDELRASLADVKRELSAQKSHAQMLVEDGEASQKKLRALADDLQERLSKRQEELVEVEEKFIRVQRSLEDAEAKISDLTEKNAALEDELDIANSKAAQLKKAEATVISYRKKLEGAGMMNQQMTDLENQSAKYLSQIVELEMETKKIPELQKNLDDTSRQLGRIQKEKIDLEDKVNSKTSEIAKLKTELSTIVAAKKMAEEELGELRLMHQAGHSQDDDDGHPNIAGLSLASVENIVELKEKMMRLDLENKSLQKQLDEMAKATQPPVTSSVGNDNSQETIKTLKDEIEQLQAELKKKDAATAKLASDKDKLETYTKKTLSKFQEKYLVALQECKAKLKEKHDKIEALEIRSAAEKSNQKKEEKLLSSTIYELGLALMQQKLKHGQ